ncbi:glycosyltransferase involved in cell wall biosynthesis [Spirosoma lacussanchae]|uniref:glycosyltransferase family 4 protein n=1 Tax=Spirosoma lacussanchae TaxID=1884249 RepID=UPI001107E3D6|nr:glycosyltransferase family 1 protein [Spirosoma lacussanchae]
MRIGIEAQRLLRPHKHGMDIVALELINALQQIDHDNEYFIFVRPDVDEGCLSLRENFTLVKVTGNNYVHWEQVALPKAIRDYRLDVLHCTANTAPLMPGVPLILTLHDVLFLMPAFGINTATAYQRFGNRYRALLVRRLIRRCHKILTVSHFASQQIKGELNLAKTPIEVLYNGVSARFSEPITDQQRDRARASYHLPERFMLFLGSADPRKNMTTVLKAFIRYGQIDTDVQLVVSGKLPAFLKQLLTPDEYAFVEQRCQFIGYIDNDDLPALYALAETFLFPSISEGFGLPILEAMACGTPVITSRVTSMPEVAGDAALLVDPHQPNQMVVAMHRLRHDPALRQTLIERGHKQVARFSWQRSAQQLLATYRTFAPAPQSVTTSTYSMV